MLEVAILNVKDTNKRQNRIHALHSTLFFVHLALNSITVKWTQQLYFP